MLQYMIYLSDMLRDCSKSRPNSFSDLSFPIIHEIESKIKSKNVMLRRKIKQRIYEKQKYNKNDQKKEEVNCKKQNTTLNKFDKQQLNYLEAYQQQKNFINQNINNYSINLDAAFDEKQQQINLNIYLLIKKKKNIFKVQEVKRKIKNKQVKRINLKECECCLKVGKHKCNHSYCEKKCQKYLSKYLLKDFIADNNQIQKLQAVRIAEDVIEEALKNEVKIIQMVRIAPQINQEVKIPQIDVEKDDQVIDKAIISENESNLDINGEKNEIQERKQLVQFQDIQMEFVKNDQLIEPKKIDSNRIQRNQISNKCQQKDQKQELIYKNQTQNKKQKNIDYQIRSLFQQQLPNNHLLQEINLQIKAIQINQNNLQS